MYFFFLKEKRCTFLVQNKKSTKRNLRPCRSNAWCVFLTYSVRLPSGVFARKRKSHRGTRRRVVISNFLCRSHAISICANYGLRDTALLNGDFCLITPCKKQYPSNSAVLIRLWLLLFICGREPSITDCTRFPSAWFREFVPQERTLRGADITKLSAFAKAHGR